MVMNNDSGAQNNIELKTKSEFMPYQVSQTEQEEQESSNEFLEQAVAKKSQYSVMKDVFALKNK